MKWVILLVENNATVLWFLKHLSHFPLGKSKTAGEIRISKWKKKCLNKHPFNILSKAGKFW